MSQKVEKPEHNKYDNIFEIRKKFENWDDKISQVMMGKMPRSPRKVGNALVHDDVEAFVRRIRYGNFKLPLWKILIPCLDLKTGAIYYVLQGSEGANHIFKGTFGYEGIGPSESALVEEVLSRTGYPIEVRSGEYLLDFIE